MHALAVGLSDHTFTSVIYAGCGGLNNHDTMTRRLGLNPETATCWVLAEGDWLLEGRMNEDFAHALRIADDDPVEAADWIVNLRFVNNDNDLPEYYKTEWGGSRTVAAIVVSERILKLTDSADWHLLNAIRKYQKRFEWPLVEVYVLRQNGVIDPC